LRRSPPRASGMSAAAATSTQRSRGQVAPAPTQIRNDDSQISAEQAEAMRRAEEEGEGLEAERTLGVYEEKKAKIGKITKKAWCIIDPRTSKFVTYWDAIGMSALIFTAIVTAVEVSFVESPGCIDGLFLVNRGVDLIFVIDGFLQFFLMFPQKPANSTDTVRWIHDQDLIALNYAKGWLVPDAFSVSVSTFDFMALNSIEICSAETEALKRQIELDGSGGNVATLKILRIVRVARLVKLVRLVKSSRIMKRIESRTAINYGILSLFKCLVGLILAAHWFACIWGLITTFEEGTYYNSWYVVFGYCSFNPNDGGELQSIALANPANVAAQANYTAQLGSDLHYDCVGPAEKYVAALYWAIMTITSIGYGDIRAPDGNSWEQAWCAALMLFGGMIWGAVIATFCGVIATLDPAGTEFRTTMDNLNRFMSLQALPQQMRQQLREYFHQTRHLQIARANKQLIEYMSPMLQGLVVWKVNEKWLRHVWFLRSAEDNFMVQLSLCLNAAVFAPAELCPHGYMYIVHRGIALYGGKVLTSGKVWGEDMILQSAHLRSKFAARCMTYVEVYMIGRDDLISLAMRYPATLKLIRRSAFRLGFRREMIRRSLDSIKRSNEARGIKNTESTADKMLVSVSSRKLDEEQAKEEKAGRAHLDSAFDSAVTDGALPPIAEPPAASGGGGGGADEATISRLVAEKMAETEKRLMAKLDAVLAALPKSS